MTMMMTTFERLPRKRGAIKAKIMQEWGGAMSSVAADVLGGVAAFFRKRHYTE